LKLFGAGSRQTDLLSVVSFPQVHFLSKMKYAKINSQVNGNIRKGVLFATYSALIGESQGGGKYKSRY